MGTRNSENLESTQSQLPEAAPEVTEGEKAKKAAHDSDAPPAFVEFMSAGWLDTPLKAGIHPQTARFRARREAISRAFPGEYVLISAGSTQVRANDTGFRFRPSSDFAYLMGTGESGGLLVLEPDGSTHRSILFVPAHNRGTAEFVTDRAYGELWVGRHRGVTESQIYFDVDACRPLQAIREYLESLRASKHRVRLAGENTRLTDYFKIDKELATALSEMRLIKDDYELDELRKAVRITKSAFEDCIRVLKHAKSEREIEAAFWSRARIEANDVGYLTIAAAGEHACTLHWNDNVGEIRRGELLLLDAGVECDSLYTADVTRTLPISGKYSAEQRAVYEIVWEAQRVGIEAVKPGNDFSAPHQAAIKVLAQGLIDLGILTCSLDEALDKERQYHRRFTLHGVSHMLGLDVHDCAKARSEQYRYGKLREGMVLTVEPGLYFQPDDAMVPENFRGIGVRIEDDVAVTANGYENFSSILPSRVDDVERWMAGLQQ